MKKRIAIKIAVIFILLFLTKQVFGATLDDSVLVTGTKNLLEAGIKILTAIGATVCVLTALYNLIKMNHDDER